MDLKSIRSFEDAQGISFAQFLAHDAGRVELYFKAQFNNLIDRKKLEASESVLPEGFEKVCGLKGSKLSGG